MLQGKHILIGISGGIAAYKIPELIRSLIKEGAQVRVTTTRNALQFVTELTLQTLTNARVYSDVFAAINEHSTEHISLPDWADMMLIAPATANVLGKMAAGIADDALTTTFAATVARKPVVIAPAMNDKMYENPATQKAMTTLSQMPNVTVIDCAEGFLACGTTGKGRMQEIDVLQEEVIKSFYAKDLAHKRILITAGPTQEALDPVRYISNHSSGKMGIALARECTRRGANVTLVLGPCSTPLKGGEAAKVINVVSAQDMYQAATHEWEKQDAAILCAAVADFTPTQKAEHKIKKAEGQTELNLHLTLTPDIAAALGAAKTENQWLIGFALETQNEDANARKKLNSKNFDMIVLNSLQDAGAGFSVDTNKVTLIDHTTTHNLPLMSKQEVAQRIVDAISALL
ncbi:MAG: bifunctional phosphopantothenoylcysteine decarboxylase/phosphopantothenate--cysteine ligase CoaBC [Paludibacteraceae bacterium]|nr:bifunctional phosphopantothenoylcysteine decarboxylase/phosphopantothenate--cysteine ligase CoaBC [Paludibacteraceae bacterium]